MSSSFWTWKAAGCDYAQAKGQRQPAEFGEKSAETILFLVLPPSAYNLFRFGVGVEGGDKFLALEVSMRPLILLLTMLFTCGLGSFSLQTANTAGSVAKNTDEELVREKLRLENDKLLREIKHLDDSSPWKDYLATVGGVCTALLFPLAAAFWKVHSDKQDRRRVATADFAAAYALAVHAMEWHTWKAANGLCVKPEDVDEYDSEIHKLVPALCGSILKASAYDKQVHLVLKPYFNSVLEQDEQIAKENIKLRRGEYNSVEVAERHAEVMELWKNLSPEGFNLT